ncbi:MAG: PAS domain S-box protein [Myxococcota bacterium]|nr:PAS domain S-box protein [Myxococcota bacterium]
MSTANETCRVLSVALAPRVTGFAGAVGGIMLSHANRFVSLRVNELDDEIEKLLQDLAQICGADNARLYMMDPESNCLTIAREASVDSGEPAPETISEPDWFFKQAIQCGVLYLCEDDAQIAEEDRPAVKRALEVLGAHCFLGTPVYYEGQPRGLVGISRKEPGELWSLDHLDAVEQTAEIIRHVWLRKIAQAHEPIRQEALEEAEDRWKSFLSHSPDTITVLDIEGRIMEINRTRLIPKQDILGKPIFHFLATDDHEPTRERLVRVFEEHESVIYETQAEQPDGTLQWVCHRLSPLLKDHTVVNALLVSTDVTKEKLEASSLS